MEVSSVKKKKSNDNIDDDVISQNETILSHTERPVPLNENDESIEAWIISSSLQSYRNRPPLMDDLSSYTERPVPDVTKDQCPEADTPDNSTDLVSPPTECPEAANVMVHFNMPDNSTDLVSPPTIDPSSKTEIDYFDDDDYPDILFNNAKDWPDDSDDEIFLQVNF